MSQIKHAMLSLIIWVFLGGPEALAFGRAVATTPTAGVKQQLPPPPQSIDNPEDSEQPDCVAPPGHTAIRTIEDLNAIRYHSSGSFFLCNDIDFYGVTFVPIGRFSGVFEGNNKALLNWRQDVLSDCDTTGFFGIVNDATIKNLRFRNAWVGGQNHAAVFAQEIYDSTIENIHLVQSNAIDLSRGNGMTGLFAGSISRSDLKQIKVHGFVQGVNVGGLAAFVGYSQVRELFVDLVLQAQSPLASASSVGGVASRIYSSNFTDVNVNATIRMPTGQDLNAIAMVGGFAGEALKVGSNALSLRNVTIAGSIQGGTGMTAAGIANAWFMSPDGQPCSLTNGCYQPMTLENVNVSASVSSSGAPLYTDSYIVRGGLLGATALSVQIQNSRYAGTISSHASSAWIQSSRILRGAAIGLFRRRGMTMSGTNSYSNTGFVNATSYLEIGRTLD